MEFAEVEVGTARLVEWKPITICPIADIHYGAETCALEEFRDHLAWTQSLEEPWYIGLGDFVDFGSPSNRGVLRALIEKGELYAAPEDVLDKAAQEHLEEIAEILAPTQGRWLGMLGGDHYWGFNDGTTSDMRLCRILGSPYLGICAISKVIFVKKRNQRESLHIWVHHGVGSGMYQASQLNLLERYAASWEGIDMFIAAHQHKAAATPLPRLRPRFVSPHKQPGKVRRLARGMGLAQREVKILGAGGFLKAYVEGTPERDAEGQMQKPRATYIERRMKAALPLGAPVIRVEPRMSHGGRTYLKLRVTN